MRLLITIPATSLETTQAQIKQIIGLTAEDDITSAAYSSTGEMPITHYAVCIEMAETEQAEQSINTIGQGVTAYCCRLEPIVYLLNEGLTPIATDI